MLSKNRLIYYALFLTIHSFQLIGCDTDPETGEKIKTNESSKRIIDKHYFINNRQMTFY